MHFTLPALLLLVLASALSALLIHRMIAVAVLDSPGHRSAHTRPTPKGGGVGVIGAFLVLLPALRAALGLPPVTEAMAGLWVATLALAVLSWLDDVHQWSPLIKLAAQIGAALLVTITTPHPAGGLESVVFVICATVWLLFVTNAVNFMDGLNGLISGVLCLAFGCLVLFPVTPDDLRAEAALLAVTLLTFLPFNFPDARIFLGDVGSQSCGLLIGAAALSLGWGTAATPPFFPYATALAIPFLIAGLLYDVGITLVRRAVAGEKILQAHRGHLYQVAYRTGLPRSTVTLVHWSFVAWGAVVFKELSPASDATLPIIAEGFGLILLPQLLWTVYVLHRARHNPIGTW